MAQPRTTLALKNWQPYHSKCKSTKEEILMGRTVVLVQIKTFNSSRHSEINCRYLETALKSKELFLETE